MKQEYNKLFDKIAPLGSDEEFIKNVLGKAEHMENKKTISIKRPIIAVAAAVSALSLGVVTAAATGLISFNTLFGKSIKVETEELGEALIGSAENVVLSVTDGYEIKLNGITGDKEIILANLEISRTDGTAITDHFLNPYNKEDRISIVSVETVDFSQALSRYLGGTCRCNINENGNLEINYELHSRVDIEGQRIKIESSTLYNDDAVMDKMLAEHISSYCANIVDGEAVFCFKEPILNEDGNSYNNEKEVDLDISDAVYLPINWSVEFDYVPSEKSVEVINRSYFTVEDDIMLVTDVEENGEYIEREFEILNIRLKSTEGELELAGELNADYYLEHNHNPMAILGEPNPIKIINDDGSTINAFLISAGSSGQGHADGKSHSEYKIAYIAGDFEMHLKNGTLSENYIAIDLSKVKAISINGREYELK